MQRRFSPGSGSTIEHGDPNRRLVSIIILCWISMLAFDFFLHGGLLARLYLEPSPFLLPPFEAFRRIPIGYISFLPLAVLLVYLMNRMLITGWKQGFLFGLRLGVLIWAAVALGLLSISTAGLPLLSGWFIGQSLELAVAGAVAGRGLEGVRLSSLALWVLALLVSLVLITISLQIMGLAPAVRL